MQLDLDKSLVIQYNNRQTIRLVYKESAKLQTKLQHVNIHNYWLRQEYTLGRLQIKWKKTTQIVANSITKALATPKFIGFVG
jgi:hypothetical protein